MSLGCRTAPRSWTLALPNEVGPLLWIRTELALSRRLGFVHSGRKGEAMLRGKFIRKEVRDGILFMLIAVLMALVGVAVVIEVAEPVIA